MQEVNSLCTDSRALLAEYRYSEHSTAQYSHLVQLLMFFQTVERDIITSVTTTLTRRISRWRVTSLRQRETDATPLRPSCRQVGGVQVGWSRDVV